MFLRSVASVVALAAAALTAAPAAASFQSCVAGLKNQAVKAGVSSRVVERALSNAAYDEKVVRLSQAQPEFKTPIWDYLAFLVDEERISDGRKMMKRHGDTLRAAERAYGVDRYVVAAVWGVESNYGSEQGEFFIPHALANLVCAGRRASFWRDELMAALKIADAGDLELDDLYGSWAGAFGQTQFIPTTYRRLAVDFDRNGRKDLVRSVPDALGSTANYLKRAGWQSGQPWGYEVILPNGYNGPSGRKNKAPASSWASRGIKRADGKAITGGASAGLLLPAGSNGPAFLVFRNFDAIYSYNLAESYALAISHLSDRLRGEGPIRTAWPTDDPGLTREQRLDLQKRLLAKGYDIGEADGKVGPATRAGIRHAEAALGMPQTGRAGMKIYRALGGNK